MTNHEVVGQDRDAQTAKANVREWDNLGCAHGACGVRLQSGQVPASLPETPQLDAYSFNIGIEEGKKDATIEWRGRIRKALDEHKDCEGYDTHRIGNKDYLCLDVIKHELLGGGEK